MKSFPAKWQLKKGDYLQKSTAGIYRVLSDWIGDTLTGLELNGVRTGVFLRIASEDWKQVWPDGQGGFTDCQPIPLPLEHLPDKGSKQTEGEKKEEVKSQFVPKCICPPYQLLCDFGGCTCGYKEWNREQLTRDGKEGVS